MRLSLLYPLLPTAFFPFVVSCFFFFFCAGASFVAVTSLGEPYGTRLCGWAVWHQSNYCRWVIRLYLHVKEITHCDNDKHDERCHCVFAPASRGPHHVSKGGTPAALTFQVRKILPLVPFRYSSPSCYVYSSVLKMMFCHFNSHYSNTFINIYSEFRDRKERKKCEGGQQRLSTPTSLVREIIQSNNWIAIFML